MMATRAVGAVLVVKDDKLLGIFTERDVVFRVVACDLDPDATRLSEVMTPEPKTIAPEKAFGVAMALMHENGFRHLPVLDKGFRSAWCRPAAHSIPNRRVRRRGAAPQAPSRAALKGAVAGRQDCAAPTSARRP